MHRKTVKLGDNNHTLGGGQINVAGYQYLFEEQLVYSQDVYIEIMSALEVEQRSLPQYPAQ